MIFFLGEERKEQLNLIVSTLMMHSKQNFLKKMHFLLQSLNKMQKIKKL